MTSAAVPPIGRVPGPRRRACVRGAVTAVTVGLALAGCAFGESPASSSASPASAASAAPVPAGLESFYGQEPSWYPCQKDRGIEQAEDGEFLCATVEVPLDYEAPDGETITLALKKRPADDDSLGALFINPGGPGGSGVELVDRVKGYFSDDLTSRYDIIGFDPRGVGSSTAVSCMTDDEYDAARSGEVEDPSVPEPTEEEAQADVVAATEEDVAACEARTGVEGLLDHIDTVSAARDLDVLRAVADQEVLTYLGYSYGTYLGATYAELFPANVGRMVLDGAVDPALSLGEIALGQASGFENSLRTYVAQCQKDGDCPLTGGVDSGVEQVRQLLESARTRPLRTSDPERPLTYLLAYDAILSVLYQSESWDVLTEGLRQALLSDDGSTLLRIADHYSSREADGSYSGNLHESFDAITCLDYQVVGDAQSWAEESVALEEASPTFGESLGYGDLKCQAWGHASQRVRGPIHATGAAPILVVGTTGDPATPYAWSQSLSEQLDSGRLLTWEGQGHGAYGRAGSCLTEAVDTYLLTGRMPQEGMTCSG